MKSWGTEERILKSRTREIPFPIPLSVICSPIHIRSAEPAVMAITQRATPATFLARLALTKPIRRPLPPKPTAMAVDSSRERPIVT